jgi:hypothetical protein
VRAAVPAVQLGGFVGLLPVSAVRLKGNDQVL